MTPIRPATARSCRRDLPTTVLAVAARTVLLTFLMLAVWSTVPTFARWTTTTVASDSMAPTIRAGDVVAAAPVADDELIEGRVALADDPDHAGRLRLHRIDRVGDDGTLTLKGDANAQADSTRVDADAVHGIGVLRAPWIGLPGLWVRTGDWVALAICLTATCALFAASMLDRGIRRGTPCARCGTPRWDQGHVVQPDRATAPPAVGLAAAVAVTALVLSTTSGAVFADSTDTESSLGSQTFPCFDHPDDGAILAWDFNEPRGARVLDRSGHGEDATMIGASRYDASCADNPALRLTGDESASRAVGDGRQDAPGTFTVEAWFRTTSAQGHVFGFGSDTAPASKYKDRFLYVASNGLLRFGVLGAESEFRFNVASKVRVDDGSWHHAVGTFRPGQQTLWVDGVQQSQRLDNTGAKPYSGYWRAGRQSLDSWAGQAYPYEFIGLVDHVRVYPTVLDAATIQAHHEAGR